MNEPLSIVSNYLVMIKGFNMASKHLEKYLIKRQQYVISSCYYQGTKLKLFSPSLCCLQHLTRWGDCAIAGKTDVMIGIGKAKQQNSQQCQTGSGIRRELRKATGRCSLGRVKAPAAGGRWPRTEHLILISQGSKVTLTEEVHCQLA